MRVAIAVVVVGACAGTAPRPVVQNAGAGSGTAAAPATAKISACEGTRGAAGWSPKPDELRTMLAMASDEMQNACQGASAYSANAADTARAFGGCIDTLGTTFGAQVCTPVANPDEGDGCCRLSIDTIEANGRHFVRLDYPGIADYMLSIYEVTSHGVVDYCTWPPYMRSMCSDPQPGQPLDAAGCTQLGADWPTLPPAAQNFMCGG
jgi:hypothetical protein